MLDSTAPPGDAVTPAPTSALLEGVTVVYCVDAAKARRLLGRMAAMVIPKFGRQRFRLTKPYGA